MTKYAKSCPWEVAVLGFAHFNHHPGQTAKIKTYPQPGVLGWKKCRTQKCGRHRPYFTHTPAWPITDSDVTPVQRPKPCSVPWEGLSTALLAGSR